MKKEEQKEKRKRVGSREANKSVLLSSLPRSSTTMSCDILPDGAFVPSSSPSHSYPAHLTHVTLSPHPENCEDIKKEDFGDWAEERSVQYQCDISCYGVTAAGDGVTGPEAMMEKEGDGEGGEVGERVTWWAAQAKSPVCFNEMRDKCPSQSHENQMEGYDAHENEAGRGGEGGGGSGEREAVFSLWPLPPHPHDAPVREERGLLDGVTVSRRAFCDVRNQDCGLSDVTSHEPSVDNLTTQERMSPGDVSNYRLFGRHSGIQLPVMTIEIEKWLMGLIVNDEEGEKRKKRGKSAKKKSKQGTFSQQGCLKVAEGRSGTEDAASDSIHSQVRFMFTTLPHNGSCSTKKTMLLRQTHADASNGD